MTKIWIFIVGVAATLLVICILCLCIFSWLTLYHNNEQVKGPSCLPLPQNFSESDLIGTWIGDFFGNIDKLIIRADGTYKQIYSSDFLNFESDWMKWQIEYDSSGYLRLHLAGMRRCDGLESECNNPGGGLPGGEQVVNPCDSDPLYLNHEVILFVIGTTSNVPRGILLRQGVNP